MHVFNDNQICQIVYDAIQRAHDAKCNWVDYVESALETAGVETSAYQPDGSNPREIVRLADGRMISLSNESEQGGRRYSIGNPQHMYTLVTDELDSILWADDADAAAREFAEDQGIEDVRYASDLEAYVKRFGGFGFMEDETGKRIFDIMV